MTEAAPQLAPEGQDPRPVVRTGHAGKLSLWLFMAVILIGELLVFQALNARRATLGQPVLGPDNGALIAPPPPLALVPAYPDYAPEAPPVALQVIPPPAPRAAAPPSVVTRVVERPPTSLSPDDLASMGLQRIQPQVPVPTTPAPVDVAASAPAAAGDRVLAGRLSNPSLMVPKGTLVAAVLETALDSTRPGGVRAIVSRYVRSFDGSRLLILR